MSFLTRHSPNQITELVFRDATVGGIVTDYAQGLRDKHLLLYGPAGSGKSIAAQMILNERVGDLAHSAVARPINPRDYGFDDFESLLNDWSAQRMHAVPRGYTVIDEVDNFSDRMREKLRAFIDSTQLGTIIVTTNNLHKLDEPFKDRFRVLRVDRPLAQDWYARAHKILTAEGINITEQEVMDLLNGFDGSARELIEWLEDHTLKQKRMSAQSKKTIDVNTQPAPRVQINGNTLKRK